MCNKLIEVLNFNYKKGRAKALPFLVKYLDSEKRFEINDPYLQRHVIDKALNQEMRFLLKSIINL